MFGVTFFRIIAIIILGTERSGTMELIKISRNALKVTLSREDMELYDIEFDTLDYKNSETRRVIWSILDEAKRSLGFEVSRDSLYIQAFRSKCGGCELFVSKGLKEESEIALFKFTSSESLIQGCARVDNCGYTESSKVYVGEKNEFYLELCATDKDYIYLDELAVRLQYNRGFLAEHTKLICENAVKTMAMLK